MECAVDEPVQVGVQVAVHVAHMLTRGALHGLRDTAPRSRRLKGGQ